MSLLKASHLRIQYCIPCANGDNTGVFGTQCDFSDTVRYVTGVPLPFDVTALSYAQDAGRKAIVCDLYGKKRENKNMYELWILFYLMPGKVWNPRNSVSVNSATGGKAWSVEKWYNIRTEMV